MTDIFTFGGPPFRIPSYHTLFILINLFILIENVG